MAYQQAAFILLLVTLALGQRPFFAGSRPIGYPEMANKTTTTNDGLDNRFGEGTTQRLPIEALGDRDLVDRLSKLPIDQQPFWLINWQALEEHRKNPQTFPERPSQFGEPMNSRLDSNSPGGNADSAVSNSNSASGNSVLPGSPISSNTVNPSSSNSELGNRNGQISEESENLNSGLNKSGDKVLSDPHFSSGNNYGTFVPLNAQKTKSNSGIGSGPKDRQDSRLQKMYERVY